MLVEFSICNFKSFKEKATLSMVATPKRARDSDLDGRNVFSVGDTRLLRGAAIYGPNASGKSNLIDAFKRMRRFVLGSSKDSQAEEPIPIEPFRLAEGYENRPSHFEVVFVVSGTQYRYGFEADRQVVQREWLYYIPSQRETKIFVREGASISHTGVFEEIEGLVTKIRPNALALSVAAQFNGQIATQLLGWFQNVIVISGLFDQTLREYTLRFLERDPAARRHVMGLISAFDLGIRDLALVNKPHPQFPLGLPDEFVAVVARYIEPRPSIKTGHVMYDADGMPSGQIEFDLDRDESDGTRKLFGLTGPIFDALHQGRVLMIDEMDARLHPLITQTIVEMFQAEDAADAPRDRPQLVFTTHNTNLLSNRIFRRDQIWFTQQNRRGESELFSLAEMRVRNDASFEKDYVTGRYGAIPYINTNRMNTVLSED